MLHPPEDQDNQSPDSVVTLEMTAEDRQAIENIADRFSLFEKIAYFSKRAMDLIESTFVKAKAKINITKIGVVPEEPTDERFSEIPADIPKQAIFASGTMLAPLPVCGNEKGQTDPDWKCLKIGFSFYRRSQMERPKIITSIFPYNRTSDFLKPIPERVAERQRAFERLMSFLYGGKIPTETFNGIKEEVEPIIERWIREAVQEKLDKGEFKVIADAGEKDTGIFKNSDIQVDPDATQAYMDGQLTETLRKPSPIHIPSYQCYVGTEAQEGWLNLCRTPSYALASREMDLLSRNAEQITEEIGPVGHIIMFGLGDAEKESYLIRKLLEKRDQEAPPLDIHGIDVGMKFHLNGLLEMKKLRQETGKAISYRGHAALFENAAKIAGSMTRETESDRRTLRFTLGNTFCNFDDPWDVFAPAMKQGDVLMLTTDIIQPAGSTDPAIRKQREDNIAAIVARYNIPQWKEWVMNSFYRANFWRGRVFPENVEVKWDDANSAVVLMYKFTESVQNDRGIKFGAGDEVRLYMSKKFDSDRLEREAERKDLRIKKILKNQTEDFGCFILEKTGKP